MTKTHSREVRELRKELEEVGALKGMDRRSALLPLFEKTGRLKLPAVRYHSEEISRCLVQICQ